MEKAKIDRINELAHKSKGEGLTEAERDKCMIETYADFC